jgi:large conductance mechanosensitive channel
MLEDYKNFVLRTNTLALAIGVIAGAATSKLVGSIVEDLFMPVLTLILPSGGWASAQLILSKHAEANGAITINALKYGHFFSSVIDFLVVSFVIYIMTKFLGSKHPIMAKTKQCPECLEEVPRAAKKCRACCSVLDQM